MKAEDIKPGMKLLIVKDPGYGRYGHEEFGGVVTAVRTNHVNVFCEEFDRGRKAISLECVKPHTFTKEDLRTGMRVQYRNGFERVVVNDKMFNLDCTGHMNFSMYLKEMSNDLTSAPNRDFDIMRVWAAPERCEDFFNLEVKSTLLFEREEKSAEQKKKEELSAKMDDIKKQLSALQEEYNNL